MYIDGQWRETDGGATFPVTDPATAKAADYEPATFRGIHARAVLVVIDEAAGVPPPLLDTAEGLVSNRFEVIAPEFVHFRIDRVPPPLS